MKRGVLYQTKNLMKNRFLSIRVNNQILCQVSTTARSVFCVLPNSSFQLTLPSEITSKENLRHFTLGANLSCSCNH